MNDDKSPENDDVRFLANNTTIVFEGSDAENFGSITVINGLLEIVYFDGTVDRVRMGRFPVLRARLLADSAVIIGDTDLRIVVEGDERGKSKHVKWYDWSCWRR